jgi:tRNA pseudouridine38-40 synthase
MRWKESSMVNDLHNYKMVLTYDGTNYSGWQIQPNALSIQQLLQESLSTILRHETIVIGAGRTDAGVHAIGQVANFKTVRDLDLFRLLGSLNGLLPRDVRIKNIEKITSSFHSQYNAISKVYHYHLCLNKIQSPFKRLYSLQVIEPINLELLEEAVSFFVGTHDFTSFTNEPSTGSVTKDPIRTIFKLNIAEEQDGICLEFEGDGFLYKMVRNIVGTLLEISGGKRSVKEIPKIFAAKDRRCAGKSAAAHGLFLVRVDY